MGVIKVDLWIVLIWPIIVFLAGTAILALIRWGWTSSRQPLINWRARQTVRRASRASAKRVARAMAGENPNRIDGITISELRTVAALKKRADTPPS